MNGNLLDNEVIWLHNVSYFNNAFTGDLIIVKNAIYYIAHTNVDGQRNKIREQFRVVTEPLGLLGLAADLFVILIVKLTTNSNPSLLTEAGIRFEGDAASFQRVLDGFVTQARSQTADIDEFGLIKPLKFTPSDVKNLKIGLKKLKFDSASDDHAFNIGFGSQKHLTAVLSANGFLQF